MNDSPATRPSLLVRIRNARDKEAWREFTEVYGPLVYRFGRRHGLQDADAADLTQEVLKAVSAAAAGFHYDPQRGSFRGWLFTLAHNKLHNFLDSQRRHCQASGDSATQQLLEQHPAPDPEEEVLWGQEFERQQFAWAAERVRGMVQEATWQAFWQTAVEGQSARQVAQMLGMSVGAVYVAKSRVQARLKEQIQHLQPE